MFSYPLDYLPGIVMVTSPAQMLTTFTWLCASKKVRSPKKWAISLEPKEKEEIFKQRL